MEREFFQSAADYRDTLEQELKRHRGDSKAQIRDLQDTITQLQSRIREKEEQIQYLVDRAKKTEAGEAGDAAELRERLNETHIRYTKTVEQYKDLFRTCEQELYVSEQKRMDLQREHDSLLRSREQSNQAVKRYADLYHQAQIQLLEAERRRIELIRKIAQGEVIAIAADDTASFGLAQQNPIDR